MTDDENKTGTDTETQTAVADNTNATQPNEGNAAGSTAQDDGLDALLKEFEERKETLSPREPSKPSENETRTSTESVDVNALARLEAKLNEQEAREQRRELDKLFSEFSDGVEADAVDAEAFLNAKALRDPRLNQAYVNRDRNPRAWNEVKGKLKQEFTKRYGKKVDKTVTESRNAVESAIRSASTAAPDKGLTQKDIQSMSKDDFDKLSRSLGITPV